MRVVFDTNILISALLFPGGRAEEALLRVIEGKDRLVISKPIIHETLGVLARKFSRNKEELARIAVLLADIGEVVIPSSTLHVLADEPDNRILECAVEGSADAIVSGDRAMLRPGNYAGIPILSLAAYLQSQPAD